MYLKVLYIPVYALHRETVSITGVVLPLLLRVPLKQKDDIRTGRIKVFILTMTTQNPELGDTCNNIT